jgi:hypothetical protein
MAQIKALLKNDLRKVVNARAPGGAIVFSTLYRNPDMLYSFGRQGFIETLRLTVSNGAIRGAMGKKNLFK